MIVETHALSALTDRILIGIYEAVFILRTKVVPRL